MGRFLGFLLAVIATVSACGDQVCLTAPNPTIIADIRDSLTSLPSAYQASLIVEGMGIYDSTYVGDATDSLTVSSPAPGVPGTYTVRVRRSGYRVWQRAGVSLGSGCTASPSVRLTVRLQPTL